MQLTFLVFFFPPHRKENFFAKKWCSNFLTIFFLGPTNFIPIEICSKKDYFLREKRLHNHIWLKFRWNITRKTASRRNY